MVDQLLALKLAGALAVLAFVASASFDRPTWCRTCTTVRRYRLALAMYVLLQMVVMLLLYVLLNWSMRVSGSEGALDGLIRPSSPVWGALALTLLLFAIPKIEGVPRRLLQRVAGVPERAFALAKLMSEGDLHADADRRQEAREILEHRGIEVEREWLPLAAPAQQLLLRGTLLYIVLRNWQTDPKYRRYATDAKNDFDQFRQRFDRLSLRASRTFGSIEHMGEIKHLLSAQVEADPSPTTRVDGLIRKIVNDMLLDICTDIGNFCSDACLLIARGVMSTEPTSKARHATVARLGFRLKGAEEAAGYGALAGAAVLLYFGIAFFFALIGTGTHSIGNASLVLIITLTQLGALAIAILPKMRWGFANAGLARRTPVAFVLGAGIAATAYALLLNLGAGALLIGGWDGGLARLRDAMPYFGSAFATAAATAWLVQDHRWCRVASPRSRRLLDAATMGAAWAAMSLVGTALNAWMLGLPYGIVDALISMAAGLVLGALVGYIVPDSYRVGPGVAWSPSSRAAPPQRSARPEPSSQHAIG